MICVLSGSHSSSILESASSSEDMLREPIESELYGEDKMKVTETEVISRIDRARVGRHGRIECHSE